MTQIGVHEAKTTLSSLLRRVALGEEIVITRGGQPAAKLVPIAPAGHVRIGQFAGMFEVPDDFDTLPDELTEFFE